MTVLLPRHTLKTFTTPVNIGTGLIDANIVRTNDNLTGVAFNAHDADTSIHVQSGAHSSRPASATDGSFWISTDTRIAYIYTSGAWQALDTWSSGNYHGAFQDSTDQTAGAINTGTLVTFDSTDVSNGVTLVSEMLPNPGVAVWPLPDALQMTTIYAAAVATDAQNAMDSGGDAELGQVDVVE